MVTLGARSAGEAALAVTGVATPELFVFLLVGLLGGAHCLGMCGPLVGLYADRMDSSKRSQEVRQHALFNLGRTAGYALAGLLLGGVGAVVFDAAAFARVATPVRGVAGVTAGAFILVTGATYAAGRTGHGHSIPGLTGVFSRVSAALTTRVDRWVGGPRIVGLGMVHALLPCPILYPVYLYALAQGSPVAGAVSLGLVGVGTFPTLFASGLAVGALDDVAPANRVRVHRVLGVAFLLLGYIPLAHGLMLLGVDLLPHLHIPIYQPLG
ncbi:sulfite exporter TauE/SafE family protein [Salinigranum sp.]|uniref:sulfite exporter TauE/SafE family protein n=1 Tax=Salinigranum sp. TaxID=1966351 RepID=UPI00356AAE6F